MDFLQLFAGLRQLRYPRAFQIEPDQWNWRVMTVTRVTEAVAEIPESFGRELGTGIFRMERSAAKVKVEPGPAEREVGQVRRVLEQLKKLLAKHEIEVLDLTGQPMPPGRQDFEILGEPERIAGVKEPTISFCERPAVVLKGRLIQTARGTVSLPAKPTEDERS